jgi:diaminopimelate dehydrogenase
VSLIKGLFAALIPKGATDITDTTGVHAHHTTLEHAIPGIKRALATEVRTAEGRLQRYIYVEPQADADFAAVQARIREDASGSDVEVFVFPLSAAARDERRGAVIQRHGSVAGRPQFLLLETRVCQTILAAQMMLAAALAIPALERRCYTVFELPLTALSGAVSPAVWRQRCV